MKKWVFWGLLAALFSACGTSGFDTNRLHGNYKVDMKPYSNKITQDPNDNGLEKLGKGLAELALSAIELELEFHNGQEGTLYVGGGLMDFAQMLGGDKAEKENATSFSYRVEQDSVLFMKSEQDDAFKRWAIIKSYSPDYKNIQLKLIQEGEGNLMVNLVQVQPEEK